MLNSTVFGLGWGSVDEDELLTASKFQRLARARVGEGQVDGVEPEASVASWPLVGEGRVAIESVASDGRIDGSQMYPQLVGSPGAREGTHDREGTVDGFNLKASLRWLATATNFVALAVSVAQIASSIKGVARLPVTARRQMHDRLILLRHEPILELLHQPGGSVAISSEQNHTRSAEVQPVGRTKVCRIVVEPPGERFA